MKLGIDPGHGFGSRSKGIYDPGAVAGANTEADIVLAWALDLRGACARAGVVAWMTRDDAKDNTPLGARDDRADANGCTHFVSLHNNGARNPLVRGTETFYRDGPDRAWAQTIQLLTLQAVGSKDRGVKPESATKAGRLAVLGFRGPACLVELGFISNPADRARMLDATVRRRWAESVAALCKTL